ncbi:MAG: hypothetical protein HY962_11545 [Ignavibacteriae bacterium]|nr:hypothetical protein [Ignavibacteriota bacterium]
MRTVVKISPPYLTIYVNGNEILHELTNDERDVILPELVRISDPKKTKIVVDIAENKLKNIIEKARRRINHGKQTTMHTSLCTHDAAINDLSSRMYGTMRISLEFDGNRKSAFVVTICKRAISLLQGYKALMHEKNFGSSLSLIKEQYECLMLFYASDLAVDQTVFFDQYFAGNSIAEITDVNNRALDNNYLASIVNTRFNLSDGFEVWRRVSNYFDDIIIAAFMQLTIEERKNTLTAKIVDYRDTRITTAEWDKQTKSMIAISTIVAELGESWTHLLNNTPTIKIDPGVGI